MKIEAIENSEDPSLVGYILITIVIIAALLYFNSVRIVGCLLITMIVAYAVTVFVYSRDMKNMTVVKKNSKNNEHSEIDKNNLLPKEEEIVARILQNNENFSRNEFVSMVIATFKSVVKSIEDKIIMN